MSTALAIGHTMARLGGYRFSPAALFEGGTVAGAWYDPSDLTTLYTTSTGTTPVAMPGQGAAVPVGLMLDKSQGLVLGSELVTNGDFSSGTAGWTLGSGWSVGSGQATFTNPGFASPLTQNNVLTAGKRYLLSFTVSGPSINVRPYLGTYTGASFYTVAGTYTFYFFAGADTTFGFQGQSGATFNIDNISVRELPGNHAISFNNTTARPELRARVNLLTYSEEFNNGVWTKTGLNTTGTPPWVNVAVAPDGTTTADKLLPNAGSVVPYVYQTITTSAISYTVSFYSKADGYNFVQLSDSVSATDYCNFNLSGAGSVGNSVGYTGSIQDVGNGWFHCVATKTFTAASTEIRIEPLTSDLAARRPSIVADGTSAILIWGADLRPANIGANVPAYQRIADANTYDTSGFPLYLFFTTDDSMYTPANLNLSGTDKVAVFAGVRALQSAVQVIGELGADTNSTNGSFVLFKNNNGLGFASRVTSIVNINNSSGSVPPISLVLTGQSDISAPSISLRSNGTQVLSSTSSQGTGNYGTHPLYIGSRGNSSVRLNGHLYSLVVAGSAVSAGNISATEQWVAQRTGLALP